MGNPKRVVEALAPIGARVGEITPGRMLILERIGHVLVQSLPPETKRDLTNEEVLQALYVLAAPIADQHRALAKGMDAFQCAVYEHADKLNLAEMPEYGRQLRAAIERAVSTMIGAGDAGGSEGEAGERKTPSERLPSDTSGAADSAGT